MADEIEAKRKSLTGTRNARVFPLPVLAAPRISLPHSPRGRALRWMSVILIKLARFKPMRVFCDIGSSSNCCIESAPAICVVFPVCERVKLIVISDCRCYWIVVKVESSVTEVRKKCKVD